MSKKFKPGDSVEVEKDGERIGYIFLAEVNGYAICSSYLLDQRSITKNLKDTIEELAEETESETYCEVHIFPMEICHAEGEKVDEDTLEKQGDCCLCGYRLELCGLRGEVQKLRSDNEELKKASEHGLNKAYDYFWKRNDELLGEIESLNAVIDTKKDEIAKLEEQLKLAEKRAQQANVDISYYKGQADMAMALLEAE